MTFSDEEYQVIFSPQKVKRILLALNFHWNNGYPALEFLKTDYFPFFKRHCRHNIDVIFFGPGHDKRGVYDNGLPENGWFSYKTLSLAYKMKPGYDGYILLNDDAFLNPILFNKHDPSKILAEPAMRHAASTREWYWMQQQYNGTTFGKAMEKMQDNWCESHDEFPMCRSPIRGLWMTVGCADFAYYPAEYMPLLVSFLDQCLRESVFLEFCVPAFTANFEYIAVSNSVDIPNKDNYAECGYRHAVKYGRGPAYDRNRARMREVFKWIDENPIFDGPLSRGPCQWMDNECDIQ